MTSELPEEAVTEASEAFGYPVEGFGASFHRDTDSWSLYTMPGTKPLGTINGWNLKRLDWVIAAMRAATQPAEGVATDVEAALVEAKRALWDGARHHWNLADFKNWAVIQQIDAALGKLRKIERERGVMDAHEETARLQRELDITNADHVALWLEANTLPDEPMNQCASWLACRIVEAYESATQPAAMPEEEVMRRAGEAVSAVYPGALPKNMRSEIKVAAHALRALSAHLPPKPKVDEDAASSDTRPKMTEAMVKVEMAALNAKFKGRTLMRCIGNCSHALLTCTADKDYQRLIELERIVARLEDGK